MVWSGALETKWHFPHLPFKRQQTSKSKYELFESGFEAQRWKQYIFHLLLPPPGSHLAGAGFVQAGLVETLSVYANQILYRTIGCKIPVTFSKFPGFPEIPVERFSKSGGKSQEMYRKYTTVVVALPLLPTNHFTHTSVAPLQTYPSLAWLLTFLSEEIPYCFVLGFDLL